MDKNLNIFMQSLVDVMRRYNEEKKKEGLIPTIDLFLEEMEENIKKNNV